MGVKEGEVRPQTLPNHGSTRFLKKAWQFGLIGGPVRPFHLYIDEIVAIGPDLVQHEAGRIIRIAVEHGVDKCCLVAHGVEHGREKLQEFVARFRQFLQDTPAAASAQMAPEGFIAD